MQATIHQFITNVWNNGNKADIPKYLSPDAIIYGLSPNTVTAGIPAFEKVYDSIRDRYEGLRIIVESVKSDGDTQTALCTVTATHKAKEKNVTFTGTCMARIENGLVVEGWCHFDLLTMHAQLGTFEPVVNYQVVSYNTLRRAIGFTGFLLPVVVVLGGFISKGTNEILPSISDYYFSTMGDVFVGCLCAVSFFLFCYRGVDSRDNRAANLAAFFALCIALFPTSTELSRYSHIGLVFDEKAAAAVHFTSAVLFFLTLSYFCIVLFRLSAKKGNPTPQKLKRNKVYLACGITMLASLAILAVYFLVDGLHWLEKYKIVTALETVMLWAFGISWLTKSQAILGDGEVQ